MYPDKTSGRAHLEKPAAAPSSHIRGSESHIKKEDSDLLPTHAEVAHDEEPHDDHVGHAHDVPESGEGYFVMADFPTHKVLIAKYVIAPMVLSLMIILVLNQYLENHHAYMSWLPESVMVVVMGMFLGLIIKNYCPASLNILDHGHFFAAFSSCLLNLVLLPIIIFESGWNMRRKDFASQFSYILLFAFGATAITAVVLGLLIHWSGLAGWHSITGVRTAFAYGALMSATDPIAALSTYTALKVDPLLNTMVFGESALNDSVAIVLFNILNNDAIVATMTSPTATAWTVLVNVAYLFFGSMSIGLFTGVGFVMVLRYCGLHNHYKTETLFIMVSCYLTAACAEMVLCSGIIAVFFEGVIMGIYGRPHLSKAGCLMANFFVKQVVSLADTLVFLLTGVAVVRLTAQGFRFGGLIMLFCLIARFVSIFPVGTLVNVFKRAHGRSMNQPEADWHLLSVGHMACMTHAGLRGAIAMVLSMELGDWVDAEEGSGTKQMLQNSTFFVIIVFLLFLGGSTESVLKLAKVPCGEDIPLDKLYSTEGAAFPHLKVMTQLDEQVLFPLLVGEDKEGLAQERGQEDVSTLLEQECHGGRGMRHSSNPNKKTKRVKSPRHDKSPRNQPV